MFESQKVDTARLIVAQDEAIRKALNFGYGPEYLLRYYQALTAEQRLDFVAALVGMVSMNHSRKNADLGRGES